MLFEQQLIFFFFFNTKVENKCQTTKFEPDAITFCIQTQQTVFEFCYQTCSKFEPVSLFEARAKSLSLQFFKIMLKC